MFKTIVELYILYMKKTVYLIFVLALSTTLYSCFKNPVTGRSSLNLVNESEMKQMANQQYASYLAENTPIQGTKDAEMVKRVGQRIAAAATEYLNSIGKSELVANYQWQFNLVTDNTANAFCMPGGKVVFHSGIMPICQNEAGVAVVMGHEVAHAIARHGNERMSQQLVAEAGGVALSVALANKPQLTQQIFNTAVGAGTQLGLLAYSREHESEADEMGLIFMAKAGYNPNEAIAFWGRMDQMAGGQRPPEFLSTHPHPQSRINDIKKNIPTAMKYYKPQ